MATEKKSATPTHPPAIKMVVAALVALKEKKGSSSQAIRKYIKDTFNVDMDRQAVFIRKALTTGVQKGILIQTKGKGASGSFKLDPAKDKAKEKAEKDKERVKKEKEQAKKAELKAEKAAAKKEKLKKAKSSKKKSPKKSAKKTPTKKVADKKTKAKPTEKVAKPSKAAKSPAAKPKK